MDVTLVGVPAQIVAIEEASQIGHARRTAHQCAASIGFGEADKGRVALVTTELANNVLNHGRGGEIHISVVQGDGARGIEVIAIDRGPGFDVASCLQDGYSTGGTRGEGLGAIKRQAEVMDMHADERGSVVLARMYPKGFPKADIRFGAAQQALHDEPVCGDGWAASIDGTTLTVMVVDGLGHGEPAHAASLIAMETFAHATDREPIGLMAALNDAMTGSRGGAVAIASYDAESEALRYTGIGNIAGTLQTPEGSRGLASHPGIVGVQARRAQPFDFPLSRRKLLVMHSDGLQSRWSLRDYPGLVTRHPAVITAVLYRDFTRGRDDVTVFAITLESRS